MKLADAKQLPIGTAIYVIPKNDINTLYQIRKIFKSIYEFDGIKDKKLFSFSIPVTNSKVRLRLAEENSFAFVGWYNAQEIEANRNVAISRMEEMIHQLYLVKGCDYDEENLKRFRQYGSAREALYAESVRYRLEGISKRDISR